MREAKIKRYRKKEKFTTIDNLPLELPGLSWRAKGILTYLMGKPSDWEVRLADLINRSTEGRDAVRSALGELKALGFLVTITVRDSGGRIIDNETYVSDRPGDLTDLLKTRSSDTTGGLENRLSDKPDPGESPPTKKEPLQKGILNKDELKILSLVPDGDLDRKSLLKNSIVAPAEIFLKFFEEEKYAPVDVGHYLSVFIDWNETKRTSRTAYSWIISIRRAIERDAKKGTVKRNQMGQAAEAQDLGAFLKLGRV